jgi:predicted RNA-binding Zn-ribbon protein involved in translation (DUF1610 family)
MCPKCGEALKRDPSIVKDSRALTKPVTSPPPLMFAVSTTRYWCDKCDFEQTVPAG